MPRPAATRAFFFGAIAMQQRANTIHSLGTPENVGPVVKGDVLLCKLEGLPDMSTRIT